MRSHFHVWMLALVAVLLLTPAIAAAQQTAPGAGPGPGGGPPPGITPPARSNPRYADWVQELEQVQQSDRGPAPCRLQVRQRAAISQPGYCWGWQACWLPVAALL